MAIAPVGAGGLLQVGDSAGLPRIAQAPEKEPAEKQSFMNVVEKLLGDANAGQLQADQAIRELATGQSENLHDVMLAVAKADLTFRAILEVRNRLTEAYQEVMRMQV